MNTFIYITNLIENHFQYTLNINENDSHCQLFISKLILCRKNIKTEIIFLQQKKEDITLHDLQGSLLKYHQWTIG